MRKSGILAHPISFPSKYGIGDLGDYCIEFIDFLEKSKQKLWQIMPLGHTGFGDSPYQSFSTFAGNPLLISPDVLKKDGLLSEEDLKNVPNFSKTKIEYGKVIDYKYEIYRKAFSNFKPNKAYNDFCKKNDYWLDDYALFMACKYYFIEERKNTYESKEYRAYYKLAEKTMTLDAIKDCFYGGCWNSFPAPLRDRKPEAIAEYSKMLKDEIDFYKFLQFEFYSQWAYVKKYAEEKEIEIVGDIPIFVASDSSDTWANRELFHINTKGFATLVAGVPPDYFSEFGQLWGNPLYNWNNHKKDGYSWWVKRVENIMELVDIVRIDHFRAFESYWSIPATAETAVEGKWKKGPKTEVFDAINNALGDVKIIAEDLGDLNEEVIELRNELGFPGMKILQFAFDNCKNAYLPHNYESDNYIVYTGTHDNETTVGWYNSTNEGVKDYVRRILNVSGDNINWDLIRYAFSSSAKYAIIPVQDLMGLDNSARMNTPGVAEGNWQFRFSEDMLNDNIAKNLEYLCKLFNR
ncbi:MAG: 4-alpha-glucanotransferase [Lachnospirales bacterium]